MIYSITVAGTVARESTISSYLLSQRISHSTHFQEDTPVPEDRDWPYDWINWGHTVGAWRCYLSHWNALLNVPDDRPALVFEDDAVPTDGWQHVVDVGLGLLDDYEVVSLHGRAIRKQHVEHKFRAGAWEWWVPGCMEQRRELTYRLCCGSLAYLIRPDAISRYLASSYDGFPVDLLIANRFKFCVVRDSPFIHPVEGSVLNSV